MATSIRQDTNPLEEWAERKKESVAETKPIKKSIVKSQDKSQPTVSEENPLEDYFKKKDGTTNYTSGSEVSNLQSNQPPTDGQSQLPTSEPKLSFDQNKQKSIKTVEENLGGISEYFKKQGSYDKDFQPFLQGIKSGNPETLKKACDIINTELSNKIDELSKPQESYAGLASMGGGLAGLGTPEVRNEISSESKSQIEKLKKAKIENYNSLLRYAAGNPKDATGKYLSPKNIGDRLNAAGFGVSKDQLELEAKADKSKTNWATIAKQHTDFRKETLGYQTILDDLQSRYDDAKKIYEDNQTEENLKKVNGIADELNNTKSNYNNLDLKYPEVAKKNLASLISDNVSTNRSRADFNFFKPSIEEIKQGFEDIRKESPETAAKYQQVFNSIIQDKQFVDVMGGSTPSSYGQPIVQGGLGGAFSRGLDDVVNLWGVGDILTMKPEDIAAEKLATSYSPQKTSYQKGSDEGRIVVDKEGNTLVKKQNNLSNTWDNIVNLVGEQAPTLIAFGGIESAASKTIGKGVVGTLKGATGLAGEFVEGAAGIEGGTARETTRNAFKFAKGGIAEGLQHAIGTQAGIFATSYGKNYDESIDKFPDTPEGHNQAHAAAALKTFAEGTAFSLMGISPSKLIGGTIEKSINADIDKFITENDFSKIGKEEFAAKFADMYAPKIEKLVSSTVKESLKMGGIGNVNEYIKGKIDQYLTGKQPEESTNDEEFKKQVDIFKSGALMGAVFSALPNMLNFATNGKEYAPSHTETLMHLSQNPEESKWRAQQLFENGTITDARRNEFIKTINTSVNSLNDAIEFARGEGKDFNDLKTQSQQKLLANQFRQRYFKDMADNNPDLKEKAIEEQERLRKEALGLLEDKEAMPISDAFVKGLDIKMVVPKTDESNGGEVKLGSINEIGQNTDKTFIIDGKEVNAEEAHQHILDKATELVDAPRITETEQEILKGYEKRIKEGETLPAKSQKEYESLSKKKELYDKQQSFINQTEDEKSKSAEPQTTETTQAKSEDTEGTQTEDLKFPKRNDDFAFKYFSDEEKNKYAQLEKDGDTEGISKMIEDKKAELIRQSEHKVTPTIVVDGKEYYGANHGEAMEAAIADGKDIPSPDTEEGEAWRTEHGQFKTADGDLLTREQAENDPNYGFNQSKDIPPIQLLVPTLEPVTKTEQSPIDNEPLKEGDILADGREVLGVNEEKGLITLRKDIGEGNFETQTIPLKEATDIGRKTKTTTDESISKERGKEGRQKGGRKEGRQESDKKGNVIGGDGTSSSEGGVPPTNPPTSKENTPEENRQVWIGIQKAMLGDTVLKVMGTLDSVTNKETIQKAIDMLSDMASNGSKTIIDAAKDYTDKWHDILFKKTSKGDPILDSQGRPEINRGVGIPTELLGAMGVRQAYLADMLNNTTDLEEQGKIAVEMQRVDEVLRVAQNELGRNFQFLQSLFKLGSDGEILYRRNVLSKAIDEEIPDNKEALDKRIGELKEGDKEDIEKAKMLKEAYDELEKLKNKTKAAEESTQKEVDRITKEDFDKAIAEAEKRGREQAAAEKKKGKTPQSEILKKTGKDWANKIRSLKIDNNNTLSADITLGLGRPTWNLLVESVAKLVEAGSEIGAAISKVLEDKEFSSLKKEDVEKSLIGGVDAKTKEQIDANRRNAKEYKALETERNRQIRVYNDLKEKLAKLVDTGKKEVKEKGETKKDTPEIEDLKSRIEQVKKDISERDAHEKKMQGLQDELTRLQNRTPKEKKEAGDKVVSAEEQKLKDAIDLERKQWALEKSAENRIKNAETELKRVQDRIENPKTEPSEKKYLTEREAELAKEIEKEKKDWAHEKKMQELESKLDDIKNRREKAETQKEKQVISAEEQAKRDEIDEAQKEWDKEKRVERLQEKLEKVKQRIVEEKSPTEKKKLSEEEKSLLQQIKDENAIWATENKYDTHQKLEDISSVAKEQGVTTLSPKIVEDGLVQNLMDSYLGKGLNSSEILESALSDLKKVLPDVSERQLLDAFLRKGDFEQKTKEQANKELKQQKDDLRQTANLQLENDMIAKGEEILKDKSKKDEISGSVVKMLKDKKAMLLQQKRNAEVDQQVSDINNHLKTWEKILKSVQYEGNVLAKMKADNRAKIDEALIKNGIKLDRSSQDVIQKNRTIANTHNNKVDELLSNPNLTNEQIRLLKGLKIKDVNNVEELGEKIDKAARSIQTQINLANPTDPISKELKSLKNDLLEGLSKRDEFTKLEAAKQKMRGDINRMTRDIAGNRFADSKSPTQLKIDREYIKLQHERNMLRAEYDKAEEKFIYQNKNNIGKGLDLFLRARRGNLISSLSSTVFKLPLSSFVKIGGDILSTNISGLSPLTGGISYLTGLEKAVSAQKISWKADYEGLKTTAGLSLSNVRVDEAILKETKEQMANTKKILTDQKQVLLDRNKELKKSDDEKSIDEISDNESKIKELDRQIEKNSNKVRDMKVETLLKSTDELLKSTADNFFKVKAELEKNGVDLNKSKEYKVAKKAFDDAEYNSGLAFMYQFIGHVWKNRGEQIMEGAYSFEEAMGDFKRMSYEDRMAIHSTKFGKGVETLIYGVDTIGRIHAATKDISAMKQFVTEYAKALERASRKMDAGQRLQESDKYIIMQKAFEHGFKGGKFSEKNATVRFVQDAFKNIDRSIEEKMLKRGGTKDLNYKASRFGSGVAQSILLPVLKIPANIENSGLFKYTLGYGLALKRIGSEAIRASKNMDYSAQQSITENIKRFGEAFTKHMSELDPDYADKIKEGLNKGQVGLVTMGIAAHMIATGALAFGGVYYPGARKKKDAYGNELNFGAISLNGKVFDNYTTAILGHLDIMMPFFMAANYMTAKENQERINLNEENRGLEKYTKNPEAVGLANDIFMAIEESPVRNVLSLAGTPENVYQGSSGVMESFFSVGIAKSIGKGIDDYNGDQRDIQDWKDRLMVNNGLNFLVNKK